jgi:hypothetical protein
MLFHESFKTVSKILGKILEAFNMSPESFGASMSSVIRTKDEINRIVEEAGEV